MSATPNLANKEEAERCELLARQAWQDGNRAGALKFVEKSLRLYPTESAEKLLRIIHQAASSSSSSSSSSQDHHYQQQQHHQKSHQQSSPRNKNSDTHSHNNESKSRSHNASSSSSTASHEESNSTEYTPEQVAEVKKMLKIKDYYQLLNISKTAAELDIKSAYRKLALKFHPDKNKTPGAADVFKALSTAYACLSDAQKRKMYDDYGHDDQQSSSSHRSSASHQQPFGPDLTPDDILNMFFNGSGQRYGFPNPQTNRFYYRQRGAPRQQQQSPEGFSMAHIVQFLPLLLLLLFSFLNTSSEDKVFSLDRDSTHNIKRTTNDHNIPYYVTSSFSRRYEYDARAVFQVEEQVFKDHYARLENSCKKERAEKRKLQKEAKDATGEKQSELLHRLHAMELASCQRLDNLKSGA